MPTRKLTPVQVLERLLTRLEKRMEALQRVKLDGFQMVISELEVEQDYLRRAKRYLESFGDRRLSPKLRETVQETALSTK
jgi:hypothetical protein